MCPGALSVFGIYSKILEVFDSRERRLFFVLMGAMVFVALAELVGLSAVFLLLSVLAQPERISENPVLSRAFETFGFSDTTSFQIWMAIAVLVVVVIGLVVKALGAYAIIRFAAMRTYSLSSRLLASYLRQPYIWFLTRNSSDTSHRVLSEVDRTVNNVFIPGMRLLANGILALAVAGFLVLVDPLVSLLSATLLCGGYALIYLWLRGRLRWAGKEVVERSAARFRVINEFSGGFREVKLLGIERHYGARYDHAAKRFALAGARMRIMSDLPRFALEGLAFGVLLVLVFVLLLRNDGDLITTIPTLGVFAYAVMRLLPALQQMYHALTSMRANMPSLDLIHGDLMAARAEEDAAPRITPPIEPNMEVTEALELEQVGFSYPNTRYATLDGVNMSIPARQTVGIVGGTGAGKTTLVDLILGLLTPESGKIRVDGVEIAPENMRTWQRTLGYVPQTIYLSDDTIEANIAFGVTSENIDKAAIERAARLAALDEFITTELPEGYQTVIGERGVRLSGGQRQRIGIARALYRNPSVLILDEATSALDNVTERVVMEAIASLRDHKTIILIAHRLTTVQGCDMIFMMEHGRVVAQGDYAGLVASNENFREMALGQ